MTSKLLRICGYTVVGVLWIGYVAPLVWSALQEFLDHAGEWGPQALFTVVGLLFLMWRAAVRPKPYSAARVGRAVRALTRPPKVLAQAARHEAAHATVAWALGGQVVSIDVLEAPPYGGQCTFNSPPATPLVDQAWVALVSSMAGNHIDLVAGHHDFSASSDVGAALCHAASIISTGQRPTGVVVELTSDSLLAAARTEAQQLLERHAPLVDAIADRLLKDPSAPWRAPNLDAVHESSCSTCQVPQTSASKT